MSQKPYPSGSSRQTRVLVQNRRILHVVQIGVDDYFAVHRHLYMAPVITRADDHTVLDNVAVTRLILVDQRPSSESLAIKDGLEAFIGGRERADREHESEETHSSILVRGGTGQGSCRRCGGFARH